MGSHESDGKVRIREAAREAIIANGFDLATSRVITSAAGVSPALLFHHYRSLEDCLIDAVETSIRDLFDRYHAVARDLTDPVLRARALLEWHIPSSDDERREWLLSFEFVRASFRLPSIAGVVERQYDRWHRTIVSEYLAISPGLSPADAAMKARRLMGLSEGLSWQLILGNPTVPEATVRQILADTLGSDLGLPSEELPRTTAPR